MIPLILYLCALSYLIGHIHGRYELGIGIQHSTAQLIEAPWLSIQPVKPQLHQQQDISAAPRINLSITAKCQLIHASVRAKPC